MADQTPPFVRTVEALRAHVHAWRREGLTIALVPTMGALHEGHLSLVRRAKERADRCIASIFVNPTQFAAHEDLGSYPRDEDGDALKLAGAGCDLIYAPDSKVMYPDGFAISVSAPTMGADLEGAARPHFFGGVATVVSKLFLQAMPDLAVFGEKDYQQLQIVKRLARDLDMPVTIDAVATAREPDGLAMSSRNAYLTNHQRAIAPVLHETLSALAADLARGERVDAARSRARARLLEAGFDAVDYVAVRHPETLKPMGAGPLREPARLLAAARLGSTRLIDNIPAAPAKG